MSTNLRLNQELADALRDAADRTGRSQQEIVRRAIAEHLGLRPDGSAMEAAVTAGLVLAPTPFRDVSARRRLPRGSRSSDLLDRADRV